MKIDNSNYVLDVTKENITLTLKNTFYEGRNVKDLNMDLSHALSIRGQLIDKGTLPIGEV